MAELVNSGIQPLQNTATFEELRRHGVATDPWTRHFIAKGLTSLEQLARPSAGAFLFGDRVGLADLYLVPQLYNARRWGVALDAFPTLIRADDNARALPAFQAAAPEMQPTPSLASMRPLLAYLVLLLAVVVMYGRTLDAPLIWDDRHLILDAPPVAQDERILTRFREPFWIEDGSGDARAYYRPLTVLSFAFDRSLHGENPTGYHLTNAALHTLNALLLLALLLRRRTDVRVALLLSAAWALLSAADRSRRLGLGANGCLGHDVLFSGLAGASQPFARANVRQRRAAVFSARQQRGRAGGPGSVDGQRALLACAGVPRARPVEARPRVHAAASGCVRRLRRAPAQRFGGDQARAGPALTRRARRRRGRSLGPLRFRSSGTVAAARTARPAGCTRPSVHCGGAGRVRRDRHHRMATSRSLARVGACRRRIGLPNRAEASALGIVSLSLVIHLVPISVGVVAADRFLSAARRGRPRARSPLTRVVQRRQLVLVPLFGLTLTLGAATWLRLDEWRSELAFWRAAYETTPKTNSLPGNELGNVYYRAGLSSTLCASIA